MLPYTKEDIRNFDEQTFAFLEVFREGNILKLYLNRPQKRNALSPTLMRELAYAITYAHYNNDIWAVVLGARGEKVFCAGADLKVFAGFPEEPNNSTIPRERSEILLGELFTKLHKPSIVVVNGNVYAGAFLLVATSTYVVSIPEAQYSLPEVKRGIWPMQVMSNLLEVLPKRFVLDWCIRGLTYTAEELTKYNFITHLAEKDKLEETAMNLAREICEQSPTAIRFGLKAYDEIQQIPPGERHKYLKEQLQKLLQTEDAKEGIRAWKEKRKPKWTGK